MRIVKKNLVGIFHLKIAQEHQKAAPMLKAAWGLISILFTTFKTDTKILWATLPVYDWHHRRI